MALVVGAFGDRVTITPSTTLAAETANNTSAANTFAGQLNNNAAAANVGKGPLASLLYPGASTRIYAHFMPWFGGANHVNVGYDSTDPAQVRRQVDDMISRGIRGAIVDWYGPNFSRENTTTLALKTEAESRGGSFEFAVMEDVGALNACAGTAGCSVTGQMISDLTYAYNTYELSPAYMRIGGRPVVFFFGVEKYSINWSLVRAGVPGSPMFITRNAGAFADANTDGGFAWIGLSGNAFDNGVGYIDNFYVSSQTYPAKTLFGTGYKGFNDSIAAWAPSPPRVLDQQCGATWLATLAEAGRYYSTTSQLPALQLVTWNDYEEGTEVESGIDNCVSLSAAVSGASLSWTVTGSEATIDHYTVFISADGQKLMPLGNVAAGTRAFDLSNTNLVDGSYSVFVKAVGKPTIRNQMSAPAPFVIATAPPIAPDFTVDPTPDTVSVASGQSAQITIGVDPNPALSGAVTLACMGLPRHAACNFAPASLNAAGTPLSTTLTITTGTVISDARPRMPFWLYGTQAFGVMGFLLLGDGRRRRKLAIAASVIAMIAILALNGCGGGFTAQNSGGLSPQLVRPAGTTPSGTYTVTVVATSAAMQHTSTVTLVVR
jgi:hypothetical protein